MPREVAVEAQAVAAADQATQAGEEEAAPTTTLVLLSLQDPVERTTKATEINVQMGVPSMEDAELRVNAQLAQLAEFLLGM